MFLKQGIGNAQGGERKEKGKAWDGKTYIKWRCVTGRKKRRRRLKKKSLDAHENRKEKKMRRGGIPRSTVRVYRTSAFLSIGRRQISAFDQATRCCACLATTRTRCVCGPVGRFCLIKRQAACEVTAQSTSRQSDRSARWKIPTSRESTHRTPRTALLLTCMVRGSWADAQEARRASHRNFEHFLFLWEGLRKPALCHPCSCFSAPTIETTTNTEASRMAGPLSLCHQPHPLLLRSESRGSFSLPPSSPRKRLERERKRDRRSAAFLASWLNPTSNAWSKRKSKSERTKTRSSKRQVASGRPTFPKDSSLRYNPSCVKSLNQSHSRTHAHATRELPSKQGASLSHPNPYPASS